MTLIPIDSGGEKNPPLVEIEVVRGRSSYTQEMSTSEGMPLYTHTLVVATPLEYDLSIDQGVIASVKLTSGRRITLGWCETDQPLRLVSQSASSTMVTTSSAQISNSPSPLKYWTLCAYSTSAVV